MFKSKNNHSFIELMDMIKDTVREDTNDASQKRISFFTDNTDKNTIKNIIKKNLIEVIKIDKDFLGKITEFIDELVEEICDLDKKNIYIIHATKEDTKKFRTLLGVNSGGKIYNHWMGETIKKLRNKVIDNVILTPNTNVVDNMSKMSSLHIEKYKNYSIYNIGLSNSTINRSVAYLKVNTLYDLLTYPSYALCIELGVTALLDIRNKVHALGLKLIDDLDDEEKKNIVLLSTKRMIEDSHSIWIDKKHKYHEISTIKDIIDKYNNHEFFDDDVLNYAYEIGIDFKQKEIDTYDIVKSMPLEERLDMNIRRIKMSTRLYNALHKAGIDTLRQIVSFDSDKILRIKNMGESHRGELVKILESIGLSLKEKEVKEITIDDCNEREEKLLIRYEELTKTLCRIKKEIVEVETQKALILRNNQKK